MLDQELRATGLEVRVARKRRGALNEGVVGGGGVGVGGRASVVQRGKDAWGPAFLDEVADDLVVEVLDGRPLDLLADVLLLLGLEGELDEDLLELLVDVVDAKLLERVILYGIIVVRDQNRTIIVKLTSNISKPKMSCAKGKHRSRACEYADDVQECRSIER